jgi:hypothetical protein
MGYNSLKNLPFVSTLESDNIEGEAEASPKALIQGLLGYNYLAGFIKI